MSNKTIPENWTWEDLGECVDILDRQRDPINQTERQERLAEIDDDERVPYYGATGQVGWIDDHIFDEELVLLGEDGAPFLDPYKQTAYMIQGESWVNNHAHVLRGKSGYMNNKFLLYYLNTVDYKPYITGTTRHKLNQTRMKEIQIPVAPINEQKRVVAKIEELFSKLDSSVSELQRGREQLKQYRLSLLKSAFEGELSKQARTQNGWEVTRDFEVHEESPDILEIPPEWRWVEASAVIESLRNGIYKPKEYYNDDGIASLRMYNIEDGKIVWKDIKRMELTNEELEKFRLEPGDLLVNRVNSRKLVGKAAVIPEGLEECVFESKNIRVKPTEDVRGEYLGHWFYLFRKRHFMSQVKQTVGQATVTQTQIKQMPIPLASIAEQDEMLEKVERRESILTDIREQLDTNLTRAKRLRQSILKHAFEGDLVPQDPTEEPPTPDGRDTKLEPGEQTTLSEVTSDVE